MKQAKKSACAEPGRSAAGSQRPKFFCQKMPYTSLFDFTVAFCYNSPMTIAAIKKQVLPILKKQGVLKAAIFGSFARGEENKRSDVDFLIKPKKKTTLFDLGGLKINLEKKLGKKVDLVEYSCIHRLLKKQILKDQIIIYEKKRR